MFKRIPATVLALGLATSAFAVPATAQEAPAPVASAPAPEKPGFRVKPYLQRPAAHTMTVNWFSETGTPGTLVLSGKGEDETKTAEGEYQPQLEYTQAELEQDIDGLEKGSWLKSNSNYKHQVVLEDLKPGTEYTYTVTQDDAEYTGTFTTAPSKDEWDNLRIVAFSDSETEPAGRPLVSGAREWELPTSFAPGSVARPGEGSEWFDKFGSNKRQGALQPRYPLTQDRAFRENLKVVEAQNPDLVMLAGDMTQGGGYQPAWDEFWGYVAGEHGELAGNVPFLTALGNWETFGALNGGYGKDGIAFGAHKGRVAYQTYIDTFGSDTAAHEDSYYRVDHGPLTILTLDSTNGTPDQTPSEEKDKAVPGNDKEFFAAEGLGTDTNGEYTLEGIRAAGNTDQPDFNPGSEQWKWVEKQLADAREQGQIIVVQFHHSAYSSGVHGTAMASATPDGQPGSPLRVYTPLLEKYGVAVVISGHDEMFERSWVDEDGDGKGVHHFDVGVAADGLRGEYMVKQEDGTYVPAAFNTYSEWMAQTDSPELWEEGDGKPILKDGGKHYGHLQMDFERVTCDNGAAAKLTTTPVYLFPVMNSDYEITDVERRVYDDVQTVYFDEKGDTMPRTDAAVSCEPVQDKDTNESSSKGDKDGKGSSTVGIAVAVVAAVLAVAGFAVANLPQGQAIINRLRAQFGF